MIACMGGWCTKRDQCAHYYAEGSEPAERLCLRGADGVRQIEATPFRAVFVDVIKGRALRQVESDRVLEGVTT